MWIKNELSSNWILCDCGQWLDGYFDYDKLDVDSHPKSFPENLEAYCPDCKIHYVQDYCFVDDYPDSAPPKWIKQLDGKMNFNEIASQKVIGERLRTLRKNRGLSQEQVGLGMGYANNGLISRIERNATDIRLTFLRDIAKFYDVDVCELIKK